MTKLGVGHFTTISGHFFTNYISNFHNISNALGKEIVEKSSVIPLIFDNDNEQNGDKQNLDSYENNK